MSGQPLFERDGFRAVAGQALRPGGTHLTDEALDFCGLADGAKVLDVGCGRGASLSLLDGRGFDGVGLDVSASLLAEAHEYLHRAVLVRGSADRIPFSGGSFAAVLCECVLSVAGSPLAVLGEIRRVLAPRGFLALSDLYLRSRPGPGSRRAAGCASGALSRDILLDLLDGSGFSVRLFEDRSRHLAELAGQLIFAGFDCASLELGCQDSGRPGYFLCVAQAEEA